MGRNLAFRTLAGVALVSLAVCLAGAQTASDAERARLWSQFYDAYDGKDWPAAMRLGEQLAGLSPQDAAVPFNLACVHALAGHREEALASLERAAAAGFASLEVLDAEPDLAAVRGDPRYASAREAVARHRAAAIERAGRLARDAPVVFHVPAMADDRSPLERPLIVALHGYGSSPADMLPAFRALADVTGAVLALPQALEPRGTGFDWVSPDHAEVVVLRAIESARKRAPFDARQVVLAGFSQGATMAMRVALRHPERFRGVLAMAGRHAERLVPGPNAQEARRLRVALLVGGDDGNVESNREAEQRLRAARFTVLLRVFPGVGHRFPPNALAEMRDAVAFLLR